MKTEVVNGEEPVQDTFSILTLFSAKLYGPRARQKVSKPVDMVTVPRRIYPDKTAEDRLVSFMRRFQAAKRPIGPCGSPP
ncbi:MAG: hypothetical protein ACPLPR_10340, partial [Bacillota bacterium]